MTLTEAYALAYSKGHQAAFSNALYEGLKNRMSESDAITYALGKIAEIKKPDEVALAKMSYAEAFKRALDKGMSENEARMTALQFVPRRKI
jgi:hypothetical protein